MFILVILVEINMLPLAKQKKSSMLTFSLVKKEMLPNAKMGYNRFRPYIIPIDLEGWRKSANSRTCKWFIGIKLRIPKIGNIFLLNRII